MHGKLWSGGPAAPPDPDFEAFSRSLPADLHLFRADVVGSLAHLAALADAGIVSAEESASLTRALTSLLESDPDDIALLPEDEDIHAAIERLLAEEVGEAALRIHAGRSRNDQVATDVLLLVRASALELAGSACRLGGALLAQADEAGDTVTVGYTHLQRAQPVLFAQHLLAHAWAAVGDADRFLDLEARARRSCPLGAGALAGTGLPLDTEATARALGFDAPSPNSIHAVSDRDSVLEVTFACALAMTHLSRLAEEAVLWSSAEFGTIRLPDGFVTGSSMMPQKRNPDAMELVRGHTSGVVGSLMALFTLMKGLPLAYMRDLQDDKPPLYAAVETTRASFAIATGAMAGASFSPPAVSRGDLSLATDLADVLVQNGVPFREAHRVVGGLVRLALTRDGGFETLTASEFKAASPLFPDDVASLIDPRASVARRQAKGGTGPAAVADQRRELAASLSALGERTQAAMGRLPAGLISPG